MLPRNLTAVTLAAALVSSACGPSRPAVPDATPPVDARVIPPDAPLAFASEIRSLRLRKSSVARSGPGKSHKRIGTIASNMRFLWKSVAPPGDGCEERWIELEPRGWVCERLLEPSERGPTNVLMPFVGKHSIVPGIYGKVLGEDVEVFASAEDVEAEKPRGTLAGSVRVRRDEKVTIGEEEYWRTTEGDYIAAKNIGKQRPSEYAGIRLDEPGAPALPLAFLQSRKTQRERIVVRSAPRGGGLRTVPRRTIVPVLEERDGAIRIGEKEWVSAADAHIARPVAPPEGVGPSERWLDVDLDEQVLVAWQGATPVYATLVSTGQKKHPTPPGIFRLWVKFAETDMTGEENEEEDTEAYAVALVPWTMYYARDIALHTSYWHDGFGSPRSHGCVNLSPIDARFLYYWTEPSVPPGWTMAHGTLEAPGSVVRAHSREAPAPEIQGYAKAVLQARRGEKVTADPEDPGGERDDAREEKGADRAAVQGKEEPE